MLKTFFFIALVGFLFQYGRQVYFFLEIGKQLQLTNNNCFALRGPLGAEDLVKWGDFVLTTNLDSIPLWDWPGSTPGVSEPKNAQPGAIWFINMHKIKSKPEIHRAEMIGFPKDVAFHPHGFGVLKGKDILFVVNHAYSEGGERVDVFDLSLSKEKASTVQLKYRSTIRFDECCMGVLNDVTPVSETEFYTTKYLPTADLPEGRRTDFISHTKRLIYMTNPVQYKASVIYFCNSTSGSFEESCKIVGPKGFMWNGITSSPDGKMVYVVDISREKLVYAFRRTETNDLATSTTYQIPHYWDNIEYDDGKIWGGGLAQAQCFLSYVGEFQKTPGVPRVGGPSPSGVLCPPNVGSIDLTTGEVKTHLIHDGSLLGGASAGIRFGEYIIVGSFLDNGVLICS